MMHKKKRAGPQRPGRLKVLFLAALLLMLCFTIAAGGNSETPIQVTGGNVELLLFGRYENYIAMLLEDSGRPLAYYKDISDTDSGLTQAEVVEDGRAFFLDGGTLGIAKFGEMSFNTYLYSLDSHMANFKMDMHGMSPEEGDKLVFSNASTEAGSYEYMIYILSPSGELWQCMSLDEPEETGFYDVGFLEATQGGWVYMHSGGVLFRWRGGDMEASEMISNAPCPAKLVGEDAYITQDNALVRIRDGNAVQTDIEIDMLNPLACFATENYLFAGDSSGVIHKYDWSGEDITEVGTASTDGYVCGIVEDYALTIIDENICLVRLIFMEPGSEETPTPEPTPDPGETEEPTPEPTEEPTPEPSDSEPESSSEPDPGDEPEDTPTPPPIGNDEAGQIIKEYRFKELSGEEGRYVSLLNGARVSDLRKIYAPQSIEAYNQDGTPTYESMLKTGMRIRLPTGDGEAEEITVVIRADCTGDGKVLESDIIFASLYYLDVQDAETEAQYLAMDMNEDGVVTIHDLPKIATEIKRMELLRNS